MYLYFFFLSCLFSTQIFQILHNVCIQWRWDGQAGVRFSLLSPSSPSPPVFSHSTSPFPGPFLPLSLYPVHSLSETPLNRHRNVYVKLTPQNHPNFLVPSLDCLQKFQFIYYILKMCILFGIGIRTSFQNSELLNLARVSSIVCFTILVLPVLLDEEYWNFQY